MTIKHLKIFVEVFKQMNVTKASENLHMVQPAVTRSIKELEKYYNITLFNRINNRIYPTENAKKLYAHAVHIIESFDTLEKTIRNCEESGLVNIGGTMTMGSFMLPKIIKDLRKIYPKLDINVTISNITDIQKRLLDNRLDIALTEESTNSSYLINRPFFEDNMCLVLPNDHILLKQPQITMNMLENYPFLLRESGSASRKFVDNIFIKHNMSVKPIWESTSSQVIINAVSQNMGISILPEKLIDLKNNNVKTKKIADEQFKRTNYIVWHKHKNLSAILVKFIDLCTQSIT